MVDLPEKPAQRWLQYLDAEKRGTRRQKVDSLRRFIRALMDCPEHTRQDWALDMARQFQSESRPCDLRQPLFDDVIFPCLISAWKSGTPSVLRLLAGLSSNLNRSQSCLSQLPEHLRTAGGLLREELSLNPADATASLMLAQSIARYVSHTLHDLPAGVLYSMDMATEAQCLELMKTVEELHERAVSNGNSENYQQLIDDARYHYNHYLNYLRSEDRDGGYPAYIQRSPNQPSRGAGRS